MEGKYIYYIGKILEILNIFNFLYLKMGMIILTTYSDWFPSDITETLKVDQIAMFQSDRTTGNNIL